MKHVDLIIEGLANKDLNKIPTKDAATYMQILLIATFLSFVNDIGMEIDKAIIKIKNK